MIQFTYETIAPFDVTIPPMIELAKNFWRDEGHGGPRDLAKSTAAFFALMELRGLIMAGPALYALAMSGGPLLAVWVLFCVVAGLGIAIAVPMWVARRLTLHS